MRTRFTDLRYGVIGVAKRIRRQWMMRYSRVLTGFPSTCHRFFYRIASRGITLESHQDPEAAFGQAISPCCQEVDGVWD